MYSLASLEKKKLCLQEKQLKMTIYIIQYF